MNNLDETNSLIKTLSEAIKSSNNLDDINSLINTLSIVIQHGLDNWILYDYRGLAYTLRGLYSHSVEDQSLAIEDFSKARRQSPDDWEICYHMGKAYHYRGDDLDSAEDYSLAIKDYTKAIELNPDNWKIYFDRGNAYFKRGVCLQHSTDDYSSAIEDFTKVIGQNQNNWEVYYHIGDAYLNRGAESRNTEDYSLAIINYTEAIRQNSNNWAINYDRGIAYLNRGITLNCKNDYSSAIKDFSMAIGLNPNNWMIYYDRGRAYRYISKNVECVEDINSALYWASKHKSKLEPQLDALEHVYSTEPFNHWSWLILLVETNQFSTGLMAKYYDLQAQLYDFLLVFKYLEYSQIKLSSPQLNFLRIIPILIYHLKGCVTTYRLFDEKLDDEDTYQLTAQEYYYYIRSAFHFCKECKREMGVVSIIDDAISKLSDRSDLNAEDYYYLGLIYYIQILEFGLEGEDKKALEEKSLSCFNKSKDFIWSKAMVELIEHDTYSDEIKGYIQEHCNLQREIDISPLLSGNASEFLHQFDDYMHFQEITGIWPYLVSSVKYNEPIWEVFNLNECDSETLKNKLQKKSVNEIFQKVVEEKKREGIQELSQEEIEEIKDDLSIFKKLFEKDEIISWFLQVTISSDRKNKDALFDKLRRYIYHDGKITLEEYLLLGYYYDSFKGDLLSTKLLEDTVIMLNDLFKWALKVTVVLGALASIFTSHLAEWDGLNMKSSLKNQYASYDNFMEFTKNISQYKQFVGDTNAYEVILL